MGAQYQTYNREWIQEKIRGLLRAAKESDTDFEREMLTNQFMPDVDSYVHHEILEHNKNQEEKLKAILKKEDWHDSADAMVWAVKFVQMHNGKLVVEGPNIAAEQEIDAGDMVSWFANAMGAEDRNGSEAMIDAITVMHNRLGCTRVCDKMPSQLYHRIHSFESPPSSASVMTPPREDVAGVQVRPSS